MPNDHLIDMGFPSVWGTFVLDIYGSSEEPNVLHGTVHRQIMRHCLLIFLPFRLVPVDAVGFPDLRDRMLAQTLTLNEQKAWIEKLQALVDQFRRVQQEKVTDRLKEMQEQMVSHQHRLLKVVRKLDSLEYKFAKEWYVVDLQCDGVPKGGHLYLPEVHCLYLTGLPHNMHIMLRFQKDE